MHGEGEGGVLGGEVMPDPLKYLRAADCLAELQRNLTVPILVQSRRLFPRFFFLLALRWDG